MCFDKKKNLTKEAVVKRKEHHVVPSPKGGWDVKRNGAERVSIHTDTKQNAIDRGRVVSRNQGTEFVIHNRDGKISNSDSHGNDPCPPRDKK